MINVAIIGLGTIAPIHLQAIQANKDAKLIAICDIDNSKQMKIDDVTFYDDMDKMLSIEKIDCVHLCLPHYLHISAIEKFAKAGINIFTEKPLGMTYEECTKVFCLEKEYNVKIGVCLQNRYNATTTNLLHAIKQGDYGDFLGSKGIVTWSRKKEYYNDAPWRGKSELAGGGVMINQSIHTLDLLSYIGGEIESIDAKIANLVLKDIEVEDSVMANLRYKNGANAMFFATNGYAQNSSVVLEFVYEKAIFTIDSDKLYIKQNGETKLICENQLLVGTKQYYGASHTMAINAFYNAILNDTKDYISVQEGAYSVKLINKIVVSSDTNSTINITK